ncbi:MAG: hypothetical protein CHACPFDD_01526 [Phycisphaerae bacterium]|nr:hypothetical protein [Phycisphaerae bacterium]
MKAVSDRVAQTWVDLPAESDFPIQNLPYGVFRPRRGGMAAASPRVGVAIGAHVLDLALLHQAGYFSDSPLAGDNVFARGELNAFLGLGRPAWTAARARLADLLSDSCLSLRDNAILRRAALYKQSDVEMLMPLRVGGFVDFYASREHATNVGIMFRGPDNALMPNWLHMPIAYNGRASSIVVSGVDVRRPMGQSKADDAAAPVFGPSRMLDFELELGVVIGGGSDLGRPIPISQAAEHIFGLVLLNDWSARDIQKWEYQPLGPFLGKSFATSISPWVVPLDALAPFRVTGPGQDPQPLPYLRCEEPWGLDVGLEVWLQTARMARPERISAVSFRGMYWNIAQMLAHLTSNGCNVCPGDVYGTGTVSGSSEDARGSMLELCWKGTRPLTLPGGETRTALQDGDTLTLRGACQGEGYRVGFGEVRATILPAAG